MPQVRPAPVARATSATHRAPLAMASRMSWSVTTLQWHTYMDGSPNRERERGHLPEVDPGNCGQVSLT
ncbi:protein of unknown function [Blastococcus saxobsidens DD2]|uniref:Uncharacterized protein n=1 Tax=Blastococcus saxobsidens (strain DD2) TaxID=1146883 RepID=H6RW50_BLASD|nr:protein of unknown function [Blastococcus saxobsidens DD2]